VIKVYKFTILVLTRQRLKKVSNWKGDTKCVNGRTISMISLGPLIYEATQ